MSWGASPRALRSALAGTGRSHPSAEMPFEQLQRQGLLNGDLLGERADMTPLAFSAARKSDRMLARRLGVIPNGHWVDGGKFSADRADIDRNGGGFIPQQGGDPFRGRNEVAQTRGREPLSRASEQLSGPPGWRFWQPGGRGQIELS